MAETIGRCRPLLGTFVSIEATGSPADVEQAFARVAQVHEAMSFHSTDSDLARLRRAPWGSAVMVSPETAAVLRYAARLHGESDGLFDVTVAARLVAAGFLPRPADIDLRRLTGDGGDIEVEGDSVVRCHRPMLIDLGGIAKGHAVDLAVATLQAAGASGAIVDAGGDLRLFGPARTIGLRDGDGQVRQGLEIADAAVATSANRATRRRLRGATVTPHRGRAGAAIVAQDSVTIVADRCIAADAFTKVALADPALARRLLPGHGGQMLERPGALADAA